MATGSGRSETTFSFGGRNDAGSGSNGGENIVEPGRIDEEIDAADSDGDGDGGQRAIGGTHEDGRPIRYNKDGSIRKRRGPNKGKAQNKAVPIDVNAIQFSLSGMHSLLAIALFPKDDETQKALCLTEHESKVLAENIAAVSRHYDLVATQKSIDWFNLIMALATIEGPRIVLVARRKAVSRPKPVPVATAHFQGTRPIPVTPTVVPVKSNGKIDTHKPSEAETSALLNEAPIPQSMQSG